MTIGRNEDLPPLPEPEGTHLRNHLKQVCTVVVGDTNVKCS